MVEVHRANQLPSWVTWADILSSLLALIGACSATKAGQQVADGTKESVCGMSELSCLAEAPPVHEAFHAVVVSKVTKRISNLNYSAGRSVVTIF